jgi:signal peptidase II|tara:strand:- start:8220 stop:8711 length:492 start_codon:yes stop_codon:yes gene_type:complete
MAKFHYKKFIYYFFIIILIFSLDRLTKVYVLNYVDLNSKVDIYLTSYLNLYLIWNKGVAFGLFSFNKTILYNTITALIILVNLLILFMIIKSNDYRKYFLIVILGGSLGNVFDRVYYSAVPDFIDFHIGNFHWFIFNVADIFISLGVICLIFVEIFFNNKSND